MDKIICVGKNYLEHARELGDSIPEKPVLFFKPESTLRKALKKGESLTVELPKDRGSVHHELEVVLKIKKGGRFKDAASARAAIGEVTVGLDMTLRDLQAQLKKNGHPWELAKSFAGSAIVGPWVSFADASTLLSEPFTFSLGGSIRQKGLLKEMRMGLEELLIYASEFFEICEGDLIFTGTPSGVGPVTAGDEATIQWGPIEYQVRWR